MFSRGLLCLSLAAALSLPVCAQTDDTRTNAQYPNDNPAQVPATDSDQSQSGMQVEPMEHTPVYRVDVIQRTTKAVDYRDRGGTTRVEIKGTDLMPQVTGEVKVSGHTGRLALDTSLHKLQSARNFGSQYLTYVLWAITPEGRPVNLGEVIPNDDGNADLQLTTALQSFGLIVTAEPYFAVTRPSDMVVAENIIPANVKGFIRTIDAKYDLLRRGGYTANISPGQLPATNADLKKVPLQLLEARNAVAIARIDGASQYAPDVMSKAQDMLNRAEDYYDRKQGRTPIGTAARAATQAAEDARLLTIDKKEQERAAQARQRLQDQATQARDQAEAARDRAELARLTAQQEQEQRQRAEAERQAAESARLAAEQQLQQAQAQQQQLAQQTQEARLQAQQAQQQAQQIAQQAQQQRERLLQQLNSVLQTRDTARGLVANMSDVLFALNKSDLKPDAKVRLAKVAGLLLGYPDLKLEIDGYTDSTGSPGYNNELSERRAATVRDFLISQGVSANNVSARGFGQSSPIASNATASGRQQNRRVELVVSGNAIGQNIGGPAMNTSTTTTTTQTNTSAGTAGTTTNVGTNTNNPNTNTGTVSAPAATGSVSTPAASGSVSSPAATGTVTTPAASGTVTTPQTNGTVAAPTMPPTTTPPATTPPPTNPPPQR